jgi:tetratricopeptide (TPR) repeat protein
MTGLLAAWRNWRERREILNRFRRERDDASERARFIVRDNLTYALAAIERDDVREANELWANSLKTYPNETGASQLALTVLLHLRRYDEADELMHRGLRNHPNDPYFATGLVEVANARGAYDEAIARCAALRARFPGVIRGYAVGAEALMAKDRLPEAEALAEQAIKLFPEDILGYLEYARVAEKRRDWQQVWERSRPLREQFNFCGGFVGSAHALIKLGRYDEADALLESTRILFPTEPAIVAEFARSAQAKGDIPEAAKRWKRLAERFPLQIDTSLDAAQALEEMHLPDDAEGILREAVDRFPTESRPSADLAGLLFRCRNYTAAVDVLAKMRVTFPDDELPYLRGADALREAGRADEASALLQEHHNRFMRPAPAAAP